MIRDNPVTYTQLTTFPLPRQNKHDPLKFNIQEKNNQRTNIEYTLCQRTNIIVAALNLLILKCLISKN